MSDDDCPLATQTAAPPVSPPRRPLVAGGLADDWRAQQEACARQLAALRAQIDAILAKIAADRPRIHAQIDAMHAENRAAKAWLRARMEARGERLDDGTP